MSISILQSSFFDPQGSATSLKRRQARRELIKKMKDEFISNSYEEFGFDYFDNNKIMSGYGGYFCDDRYSENVNELAKHFVLNKSSKILDYGCAKGSIVLSFLNAGYQNVEGIDVSSYAISQAPEILNDRLRFFDGDLSSLEFETPIDLVVSKDVLPHLSIIELDDLFNKLKKLKCRNYYFEIQCVSSAIDLFSLAAWDATHKTCLPEQQWTEFLSNYFGAELSVHYKRIV